MLIHLREPYTRTKLRLIREFLRDFDESESSNANDLATIRSQWDQLICLDTRLDLFDQFYGFLFELLPELAPLFHAPRQFQGRSLMNIVGGIKCVLQSDDMVDRASRLAQRHVLYGVKCEYFNAVGLAMLKTLEVLNPSLWVDETLQAWRRVYCHIAVEILTRLDVELNPPKLFGSRRSTRTSTRSMVPMPDDSCTLAVDNHPCKVTPLKGSTIHNKYTVGNGSMLVTCSSAPALITKAMPTIQQHSPVRESVQHSHLHGEISNLKEQLAQMGKRCRELEQANSTMQEVICQLELQNENLRQQQQQQQLLHLHHHHHHRLQDSAKGSINESCEDTATTETRSSSTDSLPKQVVPLPTETHAPSVQGVIPNSMTLASSCATVVKPEPTKLPALLGANDGFINTSERQPKHQYGPGNAPRSPSHGSVAPIAPSTD